MLLQSFNDFANWLSANYEKLFLAVSILLITFVVQRLVRFFFNRYIFRQSKGLGNDPTKYTFLKHFVAGVIYLTGFSLAIYTIPALRSLSVSLFAGAGIVAAIIGFASQQAFSNIISGLFIVIFKPFRVHDRVKIGNMYFGVVEDISLRHTVIRNYENERIIIPNQVISQETVINSNLEDEKICKHVDFGISYDSDVEKAMAIMAEEAEKHEFFLDNRTEEEIKDGNPKVMVRLMNFGDSSVNLRAFVWTTDPLSAFYMKTDLHLSIKKRFEAEDIEIPFPYRTVVMKKEK